MEPLRDLITPGYILKVLGSLVIVAAAILLLVMIGGVVVLGIQRYPALLVAAVAICGAVYWYVRRHRPLYYIVPASQNYIWNRRQHGASSERVYFKVYVFIIRARDDSSARQVVKQLVDHTVYFSVVSEWDGGIGGQPIHVTCRVADGDESQLTLHEVRSSHLTLGLAESAANRLANSIRPLSTILEPAVRVSASVYKDWPTTDGARLQDGRLVA